MWLKLLSKVGFEPTTRHEGVLKTPALNHSAICSFKTKIVNSSLCLIFFVFLMVAISFYQILCIIQKKNNSSKIATIGFEPMTSPLSAVHSNQLSYAARKTENQELADLNHYRRFWKPE
jgi:hypothetical protein